MPTKKSNSQAENLEQYRIALENAGTQTTIASVLSELGYDKPEIDKGKVLLEVARTAYDFNKTEDDETLDAYAAFSDKKTELETVYSLHRKKAKVIFRKEPVYLEKLGISGSLPRAYVNWMEIVKKFYNVSLEDTEIQNKLVRLKITVEDLTAAKTIISDLEVVRAEYIKEKGESQDATKTKDAALAKIDDWMSEFYAVARIGLEDNPQLLEALGKIVKS